MYLELTSHTHALAVATWIDFNVVCLVDLTRKLGHFSGNHRTCAAVVQRCVCHMFLCVNVFLWLLRTHFTVTCEDVWLRWARQPSGYIGSTGYTPLLSITLLCFPANAKYYHGLWIRCPQKVRFLEKLDLSTFSEINCWEKNAIKLKFISSVEEDAFSLYPPLV